MHEEVKDGVKGKKQEGGCSVYDVCLTWARGKEPHRFNPPSSTFDTTSVPTSLTLSDSVTVVERRTLLYLSSLALYRPLGEHSH